ncbi:MAG: DUF5715 family protein [Candidatus Saccharimonadales bacterium]
MNNAKTQHLTLTTCGSFKSVMAFTDTQERVVVAPKVLPSVYTDFTDVEFEAELDFVRSATAIERSWISGSGLNPYEEDSDVLEAVSSGELVRVSNGIGFVAIDRLAMWNPTHSDPGHEFFYSPPYLREIAARGVMKISELWQQSIGPDKMLSITSLARSQTYQDNLSKRQRKLTFRNDNFTSSHVYGLAADFDGCGLKLIDDKGVTSSFNPRNPGYDPDLMAEPRIVLRQILRSMKGQDVLNYVEELSGTQEHCFHVAFNPNCD